MVAQLGKSLPRRRDMVSIALVKGIINLLLLCRNESGISASFVDVGEGWRRKSSGPYAEPRIAVSRTPSPVREGPGPADALIAGLELIVSKLLRNGVTSATQHLRALLGEYSEQHPSEPLTPVRIVAGDDRNPVDYVFVSVHPSVTQDPRPDLLETIRLVLVSVYGLQAAWKIGRGPDRTRRVHFQMDSFSQAESLQPKLNHLLGESTPYQCSFVSKMLNRITYDLLDRTSIDKLFKNTPVIDHQTFYPSVPRLRCATSVGGTVGISKNTDTLGNAENESEGSTNCLRDCTVAIAPTSTDADNVKAGEWPRSTGIWSVERF
ncbi:hypothetical protein BGY98DRAFT_938773 [Russula aff. rugulosa BPL654]|nr:hypothetical protein BGY98DRAFT_938773 [Russula aff. rugulosa BPL654]